MKNGKNTLFFGTLVVFNACGGLNPLKARLECKNKISIHTM